jgi:hypothetical protein
VVTGEPGVRADSAARVEAAIVRLGSAGDSGEVPAA